MKKILYVFAVALSMASCTTVHQSATTRAVNAPIVSAAVADMNVSSQKISFTYRPPKSIRRGGSQNCINAAVQEALERNGNADVLIEAQKSVIERKGMFGRKITSVTVTGFPAKYTNIQSVETNILSNAFENGVFTGNAISK